MLMICKSNSYGLKVINEPIVGQIRLKVALLGNFYD
jgi:hypothetical protein